MRLEPKLKGRQYTQRHAAKGKQSLKIHSILRSKKCFFNSLIPRKNTGQVVLLFMLARSISYLETGRPEAGTLGGLKSKSLGHRMV